MNICAVLFNILCFTLINYISYLSQQCYFLSNHYIDAILSPIITILRGFFVQKVQYRLKFKAKYILASDKHECLVSLYKHLSRWSKCFGQSLSSNKYRCYSKWQHYWIDRVYSGKSCEYWCTKSQQTCSNGNVTLKFQHSFRPLVYIIAHNFLKLTCITDISQQYVRLEPISVYMIPVYRYSPSVQLTRCGV